MTITQLALQTVVKIPSKERVLCPNEVSRDLAVKLLLMAGTALNLTRFWTVRTYSEEGKFYIQIDADNPFSVSDMIGSVHAAAIALLDWKEESPKDISSTEIQEVINQTENNGLKIISTEISNIALGRFEFFASILKLRKFHTVFDICYLERAYPRIYLIGRKDVVDDIFKKFRELLGSNHKTLNVFLASKY